MQLIDFIYIYSIRASSLVWLKLVLLKYTNSTSHKQESTLSTFKLTAYIFYYF